MGPRTRRSYLSSVVALGAGCTGPENRIGNPSNASRTSGETTTTASESPPPLDAVEGAWPMPGYDPGRTGFAPHAAGPDGEPRSAWGVEESTVSGFAVAQNRVYVLRNGALLALDAASGEREWRVDLPPTEHPAGPAYADGRLFAAADGTVRAFDPDGSEGWATALPGGRVHDLVVADGTVYASTGREGTPGVVAALAAGDGSERWRTAAGDVRSDVPILQYLAVAEDAVVGVAWSTESATVNFALERADGSKRWARFGQNHGRVPTVADGLVLTGGFHGTVAATDLADGKPAWRADATPPVGAIATDRRRAYVSREALGDGTLHAFDAASGEVAWEVTGSGPLAIGDAVYAADKSGTWALSIEDGSERWSLSRSPDERPVQVAVVDGVLFEATGKQVRALV